MKTTKDVKTSQSEMKIRDYVLELENNCPATNHQRIAHGWMITALWCSGLASVEALVILYLVWR